MIMGSGNAAGRQIAFAAMLTCCILSQASGEVEHGCHGRSARCNLQLLLCRHGTEEIKMLLVAKLQLHAMR